MVGTTILVVEDSFTNLKLVEALLKRQGFNVLAASNAQEALAILKHAHPELILLDLQLPDMDGLQLARLLKKDADTKNIKIIALTASSQPKDKESARESGCDEYITKPFDTRELLEAISKLVASTK